MVHILLIDDNPHDRVLATRALEKEYAALQVTTILQAEDLTHALSAGQFDLVVTDYQLGWTDGVAVLRTIKHQYPDCPVVMFTNSGSEEVAVEAMKAGLDDYIIKSSTHYNRLALAVRAALERKHHKQALLESEARYCFALEAAGMVAWYWDLLTDKVTRSENVTSVMGSPDATIASSQDFFHQIHPADRQTVIDALERAKAEKSDYRAEFRLLMPDGSVWWMLDQGRVAFNAEGIAIRMHGVMANITARKLAEEALKLSEAKLQSFADANVIGMLFSDIHGRLHEANDEFLRIVGYTREDLQTGRLRWDAITPQEYLPVDAQHIAEAQEQGACTPYEKEYIRKDGSRVPILIGYSLVGETREEVVGFIIDLTERKAIEAERERLLQQELAARAQAERANRVKDEFLAVLSHELRTPLNPIIGWTTLLKSGRLNAQKAAEAINIIDRNARLQVNLIEDLLDVSRILQGKLTLNISTVDLSSTIAEALETVRLATQSKALEIHVILDPNIGQVAGDPTRLQQVVCNLLTNAVKFTPDGGKVEVRLACVGSDAVLTVSDTGKGIDPDFLPHIFDYFWQEDTSTTRKFGGLGLGLAIVRNLVELHGGTVKAQSRGVGQGATFSVSLPLLDASPKIPNESKLHDVSLHLSGIKVLVVDDEADSRDMIAFTLSLYQAEVTTVASAWEALQVLAASTPDVLLSDIGMPDMDGYELLRQVRTWPKEQGGQIPAIALTAYAGEFDQQQALAAGFQLHIPKPVDPNTLITAVTQLSMTTQSNPV